MKKIELTKEALADELIELMSKAFKAGLGEGRKEGYKEGLETGLGSVLPKCRCCNTVLSSEPHYCLKPVKKIGT